MGIVVESCGSQMEGFQGMRLVSTSSGRSLRRTTSSQRRGTPVWQFQDSTKTLADNPIQGGYQIARDQGLTILRRWQGAK